MFANHPVGERRLTASGVVLGTPGYMSSAQAMCRDEIGWPVDVFALGAVLDEAILGEAAFPGAHAVAVLAKGLFEEVPAVESRRQVWSMMTCVRYARNGARSSRRTSECFEYKRNER